MNYKTFSELRPLGFSRRLHTGPRETLEVVLVNRLYLVGEAFVEGKLEAPKHLARMVHDLYFEPMY
jgi:hypothetical protein